MNKIAKPLTLLIISLGVVAEGFLTYAAYATYGGRTAFFMISTTILATLALLPKR